MVEKYFSKDFKSVNKALNKNFLTQGKSVELLKKKIKHFLNSKYAIVCNSELCITFSFVIN